MKAVTINLVSLHTACHMVFAGKLYLHTGRDAHSGFLLLEIIFQDLCRTFFQEFLFDNTGQKWSYNLPMGLVLMNFNPSFSSDAGPLKVITVNCTIRFSALFSSFCFFFFIVMNHDFNYYIKWQSGKLTTVCYSFHLTITLIWPQSISNRKSIVSSIILLVLVESESVHCVYN